MFLSVLLSLGVVHLGQHVSSDDPLAFGIASDRIGRVDVHHAAVKPARFAFGVAHQPPVLHRRRRRHVHGRLPRGLRAFRRRWSGQQLLRDARPGRQRLLPASRERAAVSFSPSASR